MSETKTEEDLVTRILVIEIPVGQMPAHEIRNHLNTVIGDCDDGIYPANVRRWFMPNRELTSPRITLIKLEDGDDELVTTDDVLVWSNMKLVSFNRFLGAIIIGLLCCWLLLLTPFTVFKGGRKRYKKVLKGFNRVRAKYGLELW